MKAKFLQKKDTIRKDVRKLRALRATIKNKEEELDGMEEERSSSFSLGVKFEPGADVTFHYGVYAPMFWDELIMNIASSQMDVNEVTDEGHLDCDNEMGLDDRMSMDVDDVAPERRRLVLPSVQVSFPCIVELLVVLSDVAA
eukprot:s1266_g16.t1